MSVVSLHKPYRVGRSYAGLGLFATKAFKKGDFIIRYVGPRITNKQADESNNKYLFELNGRWTIDGAARRNIARYANHSCRPNAESDVIRGRKVVIRAIRAIAPGDEITYDYGKDYFKIFIKPFGCRCPKCQEKRAAERRAKRAASALDGVKKAKAAAPKAKAAKAAGKTTVAKAGKTKAAAKAKTAKAATTKAKSGKAKSGKARSGKTKSGKTKSRRPAAKAA